jgi:hypothetical protein
MTLKTKDEDKQDRPKNTAILKYWRYKEEYTPPPPKKKANIVACRALAMQLLLCGPCLDIIDMGQGQSLVMYGNMWREHMSVDAGIAVVGAITRKLVTDWEH